MHVCKRQTAPQNRVHNPRGIKAQFMGKAEDRPADQNGQNIIQPIILIKKVVHKDASENEFLKDWR